VSNYLLREECGEYEAQDFSIDSIEVGYFRLATQEDIEEDGGEYRWYVSAKPKSKYKVWVYWE
jgi:hypothetical protein